MHDYIRDRTLKIGLYLVNTKKTVRVIAKEFGVSKSTVHTVLTKVKPRGEAFLILSEYVWTAY